MVAASKQWQDGYVFLVSLADGGVYEFEPGSPVGREGWLAKGTATYRERMALRVANAAGNVVATFQARHMKRAQGKTG